MTIAKLLSEKELADRLGVTPGALAKWRVTARGPNFCRIGRRIAYDPSDVQQWIDARRVASTSQEAA